MPNPYFNNQRTFIPNTLIKSEEANAQFNDVENGFDLIDEKVTEVEGQVTTINNNLNQVINEVDNLMQDVNTIINNGGGGAGGGGGQTVASGSILQVVHATARDMVINTKPQFIPTGLTATITPKSLDSKILVMYDQSIYIHSNDSTTGASVKLQRNGVDLLDPSGNEGMYSVVSAAASNRTSRVVSGLVPFGGIEPNQVFSDLYYEDLPFAVKVDNSAFQGFYLEKSGTDIRLGLNSLSNVFTLNHPFGSLFTFEKGVSGQPGSRVFSIAVKASYTLNGSPGSTETFITFYENQPSLINYFVQKDDFGDANPTLQRSFFRVSSIEKFPSIYDKSNPLYPEIGRDVALSGVPQNNAVFKNTDFSFQFREQSVEVGSGIIGLQQDYSAFTGKHLVSRRLIDSPSTIQPVTYSLHFRPTSSKFAAIQQDLDSQLFFGESPVSFGFTLPHAIAQYSTSGPGHQSTLTLIEIATTNVVPPSSGGGGSGSSLQVKNEGQSITTAASSIDFVGPGVNAVSDQAGNVVVTVPAPQVLIGSLSLQVFNASLGPSTPQVLFDEIDPRASRIRISLSQLTVPSNVFDGYTVLRLGSSDGLLFSNYDTTYFEYQRSFHFTPDKFVAGYTTSIDGVSNGGSFSGQLELTKNSDSNFWVLSGNTTAGHVSGVLPLVQTLTQIQLSASRLQFNFNLPEISPTVFSTGKVSIIVE